MEDGQTVWAERQGEGKGEPEGTLRDAADIVRKADLLDRRRKRIGRFFGASQRRQTSEVGKNWTTKPGRLTVDANTLT